MRSHPKGFTEQVVDNDHEGRTEKRSHPGSHPAVHIGSSDGIVVRLFPRAGKTGQHSPGRRPQRRRLDADSCSDVVGERAARADSMRRHPAGKGLGTPTCNGTKHVVTDGESLWSIAADELQTDDLSRIARYWPRIHRLNRAVIGADPSLIYSGEVLYLPEEGSK